MRPLKATLIGLIGLVVMLAVVAIFLPSSFTVERAIQIGAPPSAIHHLVGDLKRWPEWGPWTEDDPTIVITLGTSTRGVGASQSWAGASGAGELVFTASSPERGVEYDLTFDESFPSQAALRYTPSANGTDVVWVMHGDVGWNLPARYLARAMEALVGPMFETGLQSLKRVVENGQ